MRADAAAPSAAPSAAPRAAPRRRSENDSSGENKGSSEAAREAAREALREAARVAAREAIPAPTGPRWVFSPTIAANRSDPLGPLWIRLARSFHRRPQIEAYSALEGSVGAFEFRGARDVNSPKLLKPGENLVQTVGFLQRV